MKIRRDVASIPARSARDTWRVITDLLTSDGTVDRQQLDAAASIMESLIADEHPASVPIIFTGAGPRLDAGATGGAWIQTPDAGQAAAHSEGVAIWRRGVRMSRDKETSSGLDHRPASASQPPKQTARASLDESLAAELARLRQACPEVYADGGR